jgi:hypothetical protein
LFNKNDEGIIPALILEQENLHIITVEVSTFIEMVLYIENVSIHISN